MADKLTAEEVVQLIESYRKKSCLWNRHDKHYRDFEERNRCYDELCQEFNLDVHEIKKKIVNLRTWFARVLRKIEYSEKNADESTPVYEPTSPVFTAMLFLTPVLTKQTRKRRSPPRYSTEDENKDAIKEDYDDRDQTNDNSNNLDNFVTETLYMPQEDDGKSSKRENRNLSSTQIKKIKLEKPNSTASNEASSSIFDKPANTTTTGNSIKNEDANEIEIFCRSIASQMRKLSARKVIELQMEIQNAVSNRRLEDWDSFNTH